MALSCALAATPARFVATPQATPARRTAVRVCAAKGDDKGVVRKELADGSILYVFATAPEKPAKKAAEKKEKAPKAAAAAAAPAAPAAASDGNVSEYGVPMPTNRVEPIVSSNTPEQNRKEAQEWIGKWRGRVAAGAKAMAM